MADDVENLQVVLSVQDAGAAAVLADVRAKIAAIDAELGRMSVAGAAAGQGVASGMTIAADKVVVVNQGLKQYSTVVGEGKESTRAFEAQIGTAARGLNAMGLEAGGAITRVEGLVGVFMQLEGVIIPLLAVGVAIGAVTETVHGLQLALDIAKEFEGEMSTMGSSVRAAGGDWAALSAQVRDFVASESMASGFTQGELAASLNSLVTSLTGVESATAAVSDSEKMLAVAEETAIARHKSLQEVTSAITEAEVGRGMALAQLDPRIKELIHDHGTLDQALQILHGDNQKQLSDTHDLELQQARMNAAYSALAQVIGTEMLPEAIQFTTWAIGAVKVAQDLANVLVDTLGGGFNIVAGEAGVAAHMIAAAVEAMGHNIPGMNAQLKAAWDSGKQVAQGNTMLMRTFGDVGHAVSDYQTSSVRAEAEINAAIKKHLDLLKDLHTSYDPKLGTIPGGGKGSGFTPPVLTDQIDQNKLEAVAQEENATTADRLADAKDHAAIAEAKLTVAMKLTTTSTAEHTAQNELDAQKMKDLGEQYKILNDSIYNETRMLGADNAAKADAAVVYHAAQAALNSFTQAHKGEKDMSESDKETYEQLRVAVQNAKTAYDDAERSVKSLTSTIRTHGEELAKDKAAEIDLANAAAYTADEMARKWGDFVAKDMAAMQDDLATYQMTNAQKVAYYAQMVAATDNLTVEDEALKESYRTKELDAYKSMLTQEVDAYKAALDKEESITSTVLDDILDQHKSFRDEFKSILDSMLKDYLTMESKMLVQTPAFQSIARFFGGPNIPNIGAATAPGQTQIDQATLELRQAGTQLSTVATQALPNAAQALTNSAQQLDQAAQNLRGGSTGAGPGGQIATYPTPSGNALVTYTGGVDAQEINTDYNAVSGDIVSSYAPLSLGGMNTVSWGAGSQASIEQQMAPWGVGAGGGWGVGTDGSGPASATTAVSSMMNKVGGYVMDALMGYGIGSSVEGMMFPNAMPGQDAMGGIGGAIGDVLGSIFGGPVGGMLGGIAGGLLGGLFGPHETAAQMPDVSEPNYGTPWTYGQFVSNMIGTYGTYNGQYIQAQPGYNTYEGGTPMGQQVAEELKTLPDNLSPVIENLASELRGLERGDTNANALEIKSQSQGMFTLESGAQVSVQSYMQMIGQFMSATAGMLPTYTLSRTYPNFNQSKLTETGMYDPTVSYGAPGQGVPPPPPIQQQPGYPGPNAQQRPIQITVNLNGAVLGNGSQISAEVAQEIAQALARLDLGTAAGGRSRSFGTNTSGGDWFQ
jgi:hypothetical protein